MSPPRDGADAGRQRVPSATYRLQLHAGFGFAQARAALPYLRSLGAGDL